MATALPAETVEAIRKAYVPGVFGYKVLAKRFSISTGAVRRIVVPGQRERERKASREAKRRRRGRCVECGAETRYAGHGGSGVSERCRQCGEALSAERAFARRGSGPAQARVLALLERGPIHLTEIASELGWTTNMTSVTLLRLLRYGFVVRPARGLYALAPKSSKVA